MSCQHILLSGPRKGVRCPTRPKEGLYCAKHKHHRPLFCKDAYTYVLRLIFAHIDKHTFNALTCCSKFIYQENVAVVYHKLATEVVSLSKIAGPLFPQRIFGIQILKSLHRPFLHNPLSIVINTIVVKEICTIGRGDIDRREKRYSHKIFQLKTVHNGLAVKLLSIHNNLYYNPDKQAPTEFTITPLDTFIIRHGIKSDFMPVEIKCIEL